MSKLTGKKLKLTVLNVNYRIQNDGRSKDNDFKFELDVPKSGKSILNKLGEYKGIKFKIISIERLSDSSIELVYNYVNDKNSKLRTSTMRLSSSTLGENGCDSTKPFNDDNTIKTIMKRKNIIGNKLQLNEMNAFFSSVGPFEIDIDPSTIK